MTLTFPKGVIVENPRLSIMYYSLMTCVLAGLLFRIFYTDQIYREVPVGQYVQVSMWPTGAYNSNPNLHEVVAENLAKDFCREPGTLTYQYDEAFIYEDYSCLTLCTDSSQDRADCVDAKETYLKEGQSQILLVTEIEDITIGAPGEEQNTRFRFVPTTEALGIQFTYSFSVPSDSGNNQDDERTRGFSPEDVLTVILNHESEVKQVIKPSKNIGLNYTYMMELAGDRERLDKTNPLAGTNELPGLADEARNAGPSNRISGTEVVLDTNCYNKHLMDLGENQTTGNDLRSEWNIGSDIVAICYITVKFRDSQWVSSEQIHISDNGRMIHRYYHGVRVSFARGGVFLFLDNNNIFMSCVDAIVLLNIPKQCVLFFMIHCLGALSKIYRRVFYEPLNIMDQIGALAVRLMAQSAQFVDLEDQGDNGDSSNAPGKKVERGISRKRMEERLQQTLKLQGDLIDSSELKELVSVCFQAVTERHQMDLEDKNPDSTVGSTTLRGFRRHCQELIGRKELFHEDIENGSRETISLENFVVSCSSNEPVEVETIVELFDRDRKLSRIESFFMPSQVRGRVRERRHTAVMGKTGSAGSAGSVTDVVGRSEPSDNPLRELSNLAMKNDYAGAHSLTLEQRKAMGFKNELKIKELMAWKEAAETEASESFKLLEIRLSKLAEDVAAKLEGKAAVDPATAPTPADPHAEESAASKASKFVARAVAELSGRVAHLERTATVQDLRDPARKNVGAPANHNEGGMPNPDAAAGPVAQFTEHTAETHEVIAEFEDKAHRSREAPWACCRPA